MLAILLSLYAISGPAVASSAVAQEQVQRADFSADDALVESAKFFARVTAGQQRGVDKIVYLGRNPQGEAVVTGIGMGAPSATTALPDGNTLAVLWIRAGSKAPTVDDRAIAEHLGRSLFLYGESSGAMWEIGRRGGVMQYRKAGSVQWQSWK